MTQTDLLPDAYILVLTGVGLLIALMGAGLKIDRVFGWRRCAAKI